jgi:sugar phosphate isomerase/epimerase
MHRRSFVRHLGAALAAPAALGALAEPARAAGAPAARKVGRVGIQLYTLRDDARRDLERTLAGIAAAGYADVELLGSMQNFGMPAARLRRVLDGLRLRAPSTHVQAAALDDLPRQLDEARTLGHRYLIVAGFPEAQRRTADDYRRWADRLNAAGARARAAGVWVGFHNHADDFTAKDADGRPAYDLLVERTDPAVVRHQLDTGNLAMAGLEPLDYVRRYGDRYWSFHIKDVPRLGAERDAELGTGVVDLRRLLAAVPRLAEKHLFVEQESYPGAPMESVKRNYTYLSRLEF